MVVRGDTHFLIDCGSTVFEQLRKHNLIDKIEYLLLTHLHGDHIGCLFQLIAFRDLLCKNNLVQYLSCHAYYLTIK